MDRGYERALHQQRLAAREQKLSIPGVLYALLAMSGWLATTALIVGGVFVALFVAAGNGTLAGFFEQFDLLARHYLAAEPLRRAAFDGQLLIAAAIVFAVTAFFRRKALMAIFLGGTDGPTITN
ncbi:MAG: hypothetical protein Q8R44_06280 [Novosphingobium sp.]|nr:hypothetical protein [Novosphingobium sp.]